MEVILLESFDRLGQIGDIVNVKNGFARNFLIPQKKALRANKENKDKFLKIKSDLLDKNKKIIEESKMILKKIEKKEIIFIRNASDNGQLYGSVSPKDIANYFNQKKISIKPSNINLHTSIKKIGIYDLNIKLHADVGCNLKINVATSEENAKKQKIESETIEKKPTESAETFDDTQELDENELAANTENMISKEAESSKKISKEPKNLSDDMYNENKADLKKDASKSHTTQEKE